MGLLLKIEELLNDSISSIQSNNKNNQIQNQFINMINNLLKLIKLILNDIYIQIGKFIDKIYQIYDEAQHQQKQTNLLINDIMNETFNNINLQYCIRYENFQIFNTLDIIIKFYIKFNNGILLNNII